MVFWPIQVAQFVRHQLSPTNNRVGSATGKAYVAPSLAITIRENAYVISRLSALCYSEELGGHFSVVSEVDMAGGHLL